MAKSLLKNRRTTKDADVYAGARAIFDKSAEEMKRQIRAGKWCANCVEIIRENFLDVHAVVGVPHQHE
jgi:bacterioferritin-associated ferredoxin